MIGRSTPSPDSAAKAAADALLGGHEPVRASRRTTASTSGAAEPPGNCVVSVTLRVADAAIVVLVGRDLHHVRRAGVVGGRPIAAGRRVVRADPNAHFPFQAIVHVAGDVAVGIDHLVEVAQRVVLERGFIVVGVQRAKMNLGGRIRDAGKIEVIVFFDRLAGGSS